MSIAPPTEIPPLCPPSGEVPHPQLSLCPAPALAPASAHSGSPVGSASTWASHLCAPLGLGHPRLLPGTFHPVHPLPSWPRPAQPPGHAARGSQLAVRGCFLTQDRASAFLRWGRAGHSDATSPERHLPPHLHPDPASPLTEGSCKGVHSEGGAASPVGATLNVSESHTSRTTVVTPQESTTGHLGDARSPMAAPGPLL